MKVNIGSPHFDGWVNADEKEPCDVLVTAISPLPFEDESVEFLYSGSTVEHLNLSNAKIFLGECYRILEPGGKLRIITIDLDNIVGLYKSNWKNQKWLKSGKHPAINTRGKMLNTLMREWGHRYIFNFEDLSNLLMAVGFSDVVKKDFGKSDVSDFHKLDVREDAKLIVEATKS